MTEEQRQSLIDQALEARKEAYAPFSEFHVGAALLAADGQVFRGVNVENSSYGLTICAERVAACSAVTAGAREFQAIAIATDGGHGPCGACRQFLFEWGGDLQVLLVDAQDGKFAKSITLSELLPGAFCFEKEA